MNELDTNGDSYAVKFGRCCDQGDVRHDDGRKGEDPPFHQQEKEYFGTRGAAQHIDLILSGILPNPPIEKGENTQC